ncbi:MAG: glycosyltransferase family 39 protein [Bacteroidetes bacterium]|nr:glycosyltransferase family 39 protein [Bacteroidota bacterium]MBU1115828.1 glycosyltransferase family 39 protein [Bacteroidota bacterium]MBU1800221.1 glycosyltransferase family 39 protein [Bacteroidota bacterium]
MKKAYLEKNKSIFILISVWFILAFFQSIFTELWEDEAYYYTWATNLDWGYFDHPPAVAFFIKLGYSIFPNEFGVRFFTILMGCGFIFLLWEMTDKKKLALFSMVIFSILGLQYYTFLALPDMPLLFFSMLFFYLYDIYLEKDSLKISMLIAVTISLMLYSKYTGLLIILLSVMANYKLLFKRKSFFLILLVSIVLFLPHIIWQYQNNFITINFHLFERNQQPYSINFVLGQILIAGPFITLLLIKNSVKAKSSDDFTRTLKFNLFGFYLVFFVASLRNEILPHWTLPILIPLILLTLKNFPDDIRKYNFVKYIAGVSITLILLSRLFFIYDFLPDSISEKKYLLQNHLHGYSEFSKKIQEISEGEPVVFIDSYIKPSMVKFYSSIFATYYPTVEYRKYQFCLWDDEEKLQGKRIMIFGEEKKLQGNFKPIYFPNKKRYNYGFIDNFRSFGHIEFKQEQQIMLNEDSNIKNVKIAGTLFNNFSYSIDWKNEKPPEAFIFIVKKGKIIGSEKIVLPNEVVLKAGLSIPFSFTFKLPPDINKLFYEFSIKPKNLPPGINSKFYKIEF